MTRNGGSEGASSHDQKRQIGFEASCDGVSVARSSRSALMCVSKHHRQRGRSVRRIGSEVLLLVGHPGLEPGANKLRTQQLRGTSADLLANLKRRVVAEWATTGHSGPDSGHRDRLDRAGLLRTIAHARGAKTITEDHARTLVVLVELVGGRLSEESSSEAPWPP